MFCFYGSGLSKGFWCFVSIFIIMFEVFALFLLLFLISCLLFM